MNRRKSWREKFEKSGLPKVVEIAASMQKQYPGCSTMLIPSPREVDTVIRTIRKGKLMTQTAIRNYLAGKHLADTTCPLVTGIDVRIAAEVAEEEARAGKTRITPYWRVVKDDGSLNPKLPGGIQAQSGRLRDEGHRILPGRGKRPPRVDLRASKAS
jgi:alkylated DNA nucleotide flippase Atl1